MNTGTHTSIEPNWHSEDFLVRLVHGEKINATEDSVWTGSAPSVSSEFGVSTLSLLSGDPDRQERLAALRDTTFPDRDVVVFAGRARSSWALDALAGRYTNHGHDWDSLREVILNVDRDDAVDDPVLGDISLEQLADLNDVLHEGALDDEVNLALLQLTADRARAGHSLHERRLETLAERLLQAGLHRDARSLLPLLPKGTWARHAIATELAHPRFGGSYDGMLRLLNEPYRRAGLETVGLHDDEGSSPFSRLHAAVTTTADAGPLVTIIMTCFRPGPELFTAVNSIISQSYQNWELLLIDDGSPRGSAAVMKRIASLDSRIQTIRKTERAGTFIRFNEGLTLARGEFVTLQDPHSWAHPRRIEIQVRDLLSNPGRFANVVNAATLHSDLSLVGCAGTGMSIADESLMFRRAETLQYVGHFDSVATGAAQEFRMRIERATGVTIPSVFTGAPIILVLEESGDQTNRSHRDDRDARDYYWSGARRFLQRIEAEDASPVVTFPQTDRPFAAPSAWTSGCLGRQPFDLLVIFDGREFSKFRDFHTMVVEELKFAAAEGLRVAVLQSRSLAGPAGEAYFTSELQDLIDSGAVSRVDDSDEIDASVVVVRHAGAVQAHPERRRTVTTGQVLVVDDQLARDARGRTYSRPDVSRTLLSWFGVDPQWVIASPPLPEGALTRVSFTGERVSVNIRTDVPRDVREVRLVSSDDSVVLQPVSTAAHSVTLETDAAMLSGRSWNVHVDYDAGSDRTITHSYPTALSTILINDSRHVGVRTEDGGLLVLPNERNENLPSVADFADTFLAASTTQIAVVGENLQLMLAQQNAASVSRVYALRVVSDSVTRRRDFVVGRSATGDVVWERPLTKFADSRWRLYASFRTPIGLVEYPLHVDRSTAAVGNAAWMPEVLAGGRVLVGPPKPSRVTRAAGRFRNILESRIDSFGRVHSRRGAASVAVEKIRFDRSHAEPRLSQTPTVSVVMPVYNVEPYLDVAISSVLNQEFADIELILVDDASTDDGRRIIRKYWQNDPRVRVFGLDHNTIGGAGVPSNIGIRAARGEFVAFADSDDHITAHGLARMVRLAAAHDADLVVGDFKTFSDKIQNGTQSYDHAVWGELPLNTPISALNYPALFRLSPVPWRKLYRRSFLVKHQIAYPEGDYFYEDNPLHWFALARANTVVMCDEVISFHRMEREGQTMSAATYKLGAFVSHMNTILGYLNTGTSKNRDALFEAFFNYLARTNWVANDQAQESAKGLIRYGMNDVYRRARLAAPDAKVEPELRARLASYGNAYPDTDLTIVIPVFNSADLLQQTVNSVLGITGIRFNVLLIDDGSTDASLRIMEEYENAHENVHVFAQGNRGAGRARNSVIPLCTGRYTFFLDADDVIDPESLVAAVAQADADAADLLFFKYRLEFTDEGRTAKMSNSDREIWRKLRASHHQSERQRLVAGLINYPWNRIIRTSLLHDSNIFFGATVVNNDVQYHWHSIVSARRISTLDVTVCTHRKFATRDQVTNIRDERRMAVLEATRSTHERIASLDAFPNVRHEWQEFATNLLSWAKDRVPESLHSEYEDRRTDLLRMFNTD